MDVVEGLGEVVRLYEGKNHVDPSALLRMTISYKQNGHSACPKRFMPGAESRLLFVVMQSRARPLAGRIYFALA